MRPRYSARRLADFARALRIHRQLAVRDRWSRAQLEEFQRTQLRQLVAHAVARSPLQRERLGGLADAELRQLPAMDKTLLMERWDDAVTDPALRLVDVEAHLAALERDDYLPGGYRAMASGGTTGQRGVFVFSREEWSTCLAGFLRWSDFMGVRPRVPRVRVAAVGAVSPLHMTARFADTVDVGLRRVLRLDARAQVDELDAALWRFRTAKLHG